MSETRKEIEKKFHNVLRVGKSGQRWSPELEEVIKEDSLWANMKYYSVERQSRQAVIQWFSENCRGKRVLDYCCGNGDDSFIIASCGAESVFGIDLSEVSVNNCTSRAAREGCDKVTSFMVMDAEALEFEDNFFDVVSEYGALHHLNLSKAYAEISRVLKPDGKCICTETLRHNPIIHYYRKKTPEIRTEWEVEHILRKSDIENAKEYFYDVDVLGCFHLTSLMAVPFRNMSGFTYLLTMLEAIDSMILKLPFIKWQAWQVVFVLSNPRG
ncbi:MAG: methyltransferase domain-containing protein [Deltaproteobacteria bacterium]|nr:methyltransferase domain-containing protein [Deltaproteobacteria bacterium]